MIGTYGPTSRDRDRWKEDWSSDWANVDFGAAFDNYYFGSTPFEDPQLYMELFPFLTWMVMSPSGSARERVEEHMDRARIARLTQETVKQWHQPPTGAYAYCWTPKAELQFSGRSTIPSHA